MPDSWMLVVKTSFSESLELEYQDRALLVLQLARFTKRGLRDPYLLHEFRNEGGTLIAFVSQSYIAHHVDPPLTKSR
jgi:hypothetical protein